MEKLIVILAYYTFRILGYIWYRFVLILISSTFGFGDVVAAGFNKKVIAVISLDIIEADYNNEEHARQVLRLTDMYAQDAMGMEKPLPNATKIRLIDRLRELDNAFTLLAYHEEQTLGIANCFISLSTFEARKVINIHDLAVEPELRGLGIGKQLLRAVQKRAKKLKCCRITLEVRENNPAKDLYERFGFENGEPHMLFMSKELY